MEACRSARCAGGVRVSRWGDPPLGPGQRGATATAGGWFDLLGPVRASHPCQAVAPMTGLPALLPLARAAFAWLARATRRRVRRIVRLFAGLGSCLRRGPVLARRLRRVRRIPARSPTQRGQFHPQGLDQLRLLGKQFRLPSQQLRLLGQLHAQHRDQRRQLLIRGRHRRLGHAPQSNGDQTPTASTDTPQLTRGSDCLRRRCRASFRRASCYLLEIRLEAIQLSPSRAYLLDASPHTPGHDRQFPGMLISPLLSFDSGLAIGSREIHLQSLPAGRGI